MGPRWLELLKFCSYLLLSGGTLSAKDRRTFATGIALVVIGLLMLGFTFYLAVRAFLATGSEPEFAKVFGGALSYISSQMASNGGSGWLGVYANVIIVLLIMAIFLGIALAVGSVVLGKGVELLK